MDPEFIYDIITINTNHLNLDFPNVFIAKNYHQFLTINNKLTKNMNIEISRKEAENLIALSYKWHNTIVFNHKNIQSNYNYAKTITHEMWHLFSIKTTNNQIKKDLFFQTKYNYIDIMRNNLFSEIKIKESLKILMKDSEFIPYLFSFTCLGEAGFAHHKFKQYFNIDTKQIQKEILSSPQTFII